MRDSEKDRAAENVVELKITFQMALGDKRKYPTQEFNAFVKAARQYIEITGKDKLIHREVARAIHGLREFLAVERKRIPGTILYEADRLECLLFAGYDPYFEGDEPPGL